SCFATTRRPPTSTLFPYTTLFRSRPSYKAISGSSVWRGGVMRNAGLPITLIVVGSARLLWYFRLFPDIDWIIAVGLVLGGSAMIDRKSTRLNSSHVKISYAVFCLK